MDKNEQLKTFIDSFSEPLKQQMLAELKGQIAHTIKDLTDFDYDEMIAVGDYAQYVLLIQQGLDQNFQSVDSASRTLD